MFFTILHAQINIKSNVPEGNVYCALRKFSGPREFTSFMFENLEMTKSSLGTLAKFLYAHLCIALQCVLNAGRQVE